MSKQNGNILKYVLVGILVVAGILLNLMQWNTLREEQAVKEDEEQQLELAETRLASMQALAERSDEMEEELELLSQLLPEEPAEDQLILDLQSGADLSDMNFNQVRFGERRDNDGYVEMPLSLVFAGDYHELLHFLDYLQVYERAVRIDELRIDGNDEDANTVNIQASTFYAGAVEEVEEVEEEDEGELQ
ncbi:type 4a pilus biogenesis protein PilO [Dethiobacter alkaliphilus]|uniref:Tfp pilus assembly protein PilO n=1 Tax=Dethiobacter alkaliphilus AHT 1 TaxID=555088 RepID=C0GE58_DETAL|nr:type 4a pilus biogenesis protein PilO [Dethiobacter alkaliphilus]EEG78352.1 tfp pilus assembly protein PilO [Dethiobacter alkaliphilus AHT 1]